jgi:hypothetical protein
MVKPETLEKHAEKGDYAEFDRGRGRALGWLRQAGLLTLLHCAIGFTPTSTTAATASSDFILEPLATIMFKAGGGKGSVLMLSSPDCLRDDASASTSWLLSPDTLIPFTNVASASSPPTQSSTTSTCVRASLICAARICPSASRAYDSTRTCVPVKSCREDRSISWAALLSRRGASFCSNVSLAISASDARCAASAARSLALAISPWASPRAALAWAVSDPSSAIRSSDTAKSRFKYPSRTFAIQTTPTVVAAVATRDKISPMLDQENNHSAASGEGVHIRLPPIIPILALFALLVIGAFGVMALWKNRPK